MHRIARDYALVTNALTRSPLFAVWPPSDLHDLVQISSVQRYAAGDWIYHLGDRVRGLFVVVSGCLENSLLEEKGRRYVLDYVAPGGIIGIIPTLDRQSALTDIR